MKNIKGFTLIELLAVIVILAVVALIATPLIMVTIGDAKEGALKNSARNIIHVAETKYAEKLMANTNTVPEITLDELKWKGEKVDDGVITFDEVGKANIAVSKGDLCVYKKSTDIDVTLEKGLTTEECLAKVDSDSNEIVGGGMNEHGFYYDEPYVGYVEALGYEIHLYIREGGVLDVVVPDIDTTQTGSYTFNDKTFIPKPIHFSAQSSAITNEAPSYFN